MDRWVVLVPVLDGGISGSRTCWKNDRPETRLTVSFLKTDDKPPKLLEIPIGEPVESVIIRALSYPK
jgi:hypothetical protein